MKNKHSVSRSGKKIFTVKFKARDLRIRYLLVHVSTKSAEIREMKSIAHFN